MIFNESETMKLDKAKLMDGWIGGVCCAIGGAEPVASTKLLVTVQYYSCTVLQSSSSVLTTRITARRHVSLTTQSR